MDASTVLWERWSAQVKELFPTIHGHQKKALALFVIGIVFTGNAVLQRVAEGISLHGIDPAKMTSIERRLARFLANDRVVTRDQDAPCLRASALVYFLVLGGMKGC